MQSKWKNPNINLGEVKAHSSRTVYFYAIKPVDIKEMKSSCGCTKPEYYSKEYRIKVIYKADALPAHLESQTIRTHVFITYDDDSTEKLYINLTKVKG